MASKDEMFVCNCAWTYILFVIHLDFYLYFRLPLECGVHFSPVQGISFGWVINFLCCNPKKRWAIMLPFIANSLMHLLAKIYQNRTSFNKIIAKKLRVQVFAPHCTRPKYASHHHHKISLRGGSTLGPGGHRPPKCWPGPPNILVPTAKIRVLKI